MLRLPSIRSLFVLFTAIVLAGCNENIDGDMSRCTDPFGPPAPVNVTLDDFAVSPGDDLGTTNLDNTFMRAFFKAIQPVEGTENEDWYQALADKVGALSKPFLGFEGEYTEYTSVRNMPDLMEALIVDGNINAFNNARNAMRRCVEQGAPGTYENNHVRIEEAVEDGGDPEEAEIWRLNVEYSHRHAPLFPVPPHVDRFITFTDLRMTYQAQYRPSTFEGTGINTPWIVRVLFNRDTDADEPQLTFSSQRPDPINDLDVDVWLWSSPETPRQITDPDNNTYTFQCMVVRNDFGAGEVEILLRESSCSLLDAGETGSSDGVLEIFTYEMTEAAKNNRAHTAP